MGIDTDFEARLSAGYSMVTVSVLYWMPDHRNLLNEFVWQTLDLRPRYPRVERFIDYWRREIEAVINEVRITDGPILSPADWRTAKVWRL
jgi:uncharacterized protein Usg